MVKALRVAMIVWPALNILMGIGFLFFPTKLGEVMAISGGADNATLSILATLGVFLIVVSVFIIIAARDPLKHILWVQCVTAFAVFDVAVKVYTIIRGYVTFSQIGLPLIVDAIFAVAFLALYPWRRSRIVEQATL
jgi:hypothetical protein